MDWPGLGAEGEGEGFSEGAGCADDEDCWGHGFVQRGGERGEGVGGDRCSWEY